MNGRWVSAQIPVRWFSGGGGLPERLMRGLLVALLGVSSALRAQVEPEYEQAPVRYSATAPTNRFTRLLTEVAAGRVGLVSTGELGTVRGLLASLGVPEESQVLVFSKTSLQRKRIAPQTPRAIYFSDDCYVGWVPGGLMELAVTDPWLGIVFYRVEAGDQGRGLEVQRDAECLACHATSRTRGWPGLMVRSVFPDARGEPIGKAGSFLIGHDSPIAERWGGWYVTGYHGSARHLGNEVAVETEAGASLDREAGANVKRLDRYFPVRGYLRPDSDIVALMVLEHQVMVHNRLSEGALRVRKWTHYQQQLQRELGERVTEAPTGTALRVVEGEAERILEALLFCGEVALPAGGIRGAGDFERAFLARRRPDGVGRSLRDFELRTRLFTYRCSYMIYSEAFDHLPLALKRRVAQRLREVLMSETVPSRYAHLDGAERSAIWAILQATKPELAGLAAGD